MVVVFLGVTILVDVMVVIVGVTILAVLLTMALMVFVRP